MTHGDITSHGGPRTGAEAINKGTANAVYILYLLVVVPLFPLVGVVIALSSRNGAPELLRSHYQNQIGLFIRGVIYSVAGFVVSFVLSLTGVGMPLAVILGLVVLAWWYMRVFKGMGTLSKGDLIDDPSNWGF